LAGIRTRPSPACPQTMTVSGAVTMSSTTVTPASCSDLDAPLQCVMPLQRRVVCMSVHVHVHVRAYECAAVNKGTPGCARAALMMQFVAP
jgi:hypothetical protein